ncbi:MAG: class I SAM-dependent methyltransferase [Pyrinomonadaceae bacterium]
MLERQNFPEMAKDTTTRKLYDRIADVHNVTLRMSGYRKSVAKYIRSLDLELGAEPMVLDAGCGTGILTLSLVSAGVQNATVVSLDLSMKSLEVAREQYQKDKFIEIDKTYPVQGDITRFPFADNTFDLLLTSGALEYVPLDNGLREMARVLKPGGHLVLIPVKPSVVGSVLEVLYKFKSHKIEDVKRVALRYFSIVGNYDFPPVEPIGWSKKIFLLEKKKAENVPHKNGNASHFAAI